MDKLAPTSNNLMVKPPNISLKPFIPKKAKTEPSLISHSGDSFVKTQGDKDYIRERVAETRQDWKYKGKRLGMAAAATASVKAMPLLAATTLGLGGAAVVPLAVIAGLVVAGVEEKKIGIGKKLGGFVGDKVGAGVGYIKAKREQATGKTQSTEPEKINLPRQTPTGARPKEPLLPSLLHRAQEKITGKKPEQGRAGRIGANMGAMAVSASTLIAVPTVVASLVGGPIGFAASTVIGGILGFVAGNVEENAIGVGSAIGELAGKAVGKIKSGISRVFRRSGNVESVDNSGKETVSAKEVPKKESPKKESPLMGLNNVISEPIMGFMMNSATTASYLFQEKPVQTMDFIEKTGDSKINKQRLQDNFKKLAGINGTTGKEQLVSKELQTQLDLLGISHKTREDGTVIATIPGTVKDAPTILLSAHQDTVSPTNPDAIIFDGFRIRSDEKHILGSDDRAGIAEIIEGVRTVLEKGLDHPEIKLVFTVAEETGCKGSSRLNPEDISHRPTLGFVLDATDKSNLYLKMDGDAFNVKGAGYNFSQEDPLIQVAMKSMADVGIKPRPIHAPPIAGAQSDANTVAFNNKLIRSIAVGSGASDIHTSIENIKIQDMEQISQSVVGYIINACDLKVDENQQIVNRFG